MALVNHPILAVWEAMNLLAELDPLQNIPDVSKRLAEAEATLFSLARALAECTEPADWPPPSLVID